MCGLYRGADRLTTKENGQLPRAEDLLLVLAERGPFMPCGRIILEQLMSIG